MGEIVHFDFNKNERTQKKKPKKRLPESLKSRIDD